MYYVTPRNLKNNIVRAVGHRDSDVLCCLLFLSRQTQWQYFQASATLRRVAQNCEKVTISFVKSVGPFRPHTTTRLPPEGFSWNMTFLYFSKNLSRKFKFLEQRVLERKIYVHLWQYLAEFFLEWGMFQIQVADKVKTRISRPTTFHENRVVYELKWKKLVEPDRPQISYGACALYAV